MKKMIFIVLLSVASHTYAGDGGATMDMCNKAIFEAKDTLQTYRSTLKKNLDGGYITQANYDEAISKFKQIESALTDQQCMSSTGKELEIYRCLANNYGDVMGCTKS
ncbi:MAG: hypothetical protein PVI97_08995 [Candidatus Thiodiazotropha sp.]|jgi:hypothetical protein